MLSRTFTICLLAGLVAVPVFTGPTSAGGPKEAVERADSTTFAGFDTVRLLASFGEPRRAYELYSWSNQNGVDDPERLRLEIRLLTEMGMYRRADSLLATLDPLGDDEEVFAFYLRRGYLNLLDGRFERALDMLSRTDSIPGYGLTFYRDFVRLRANLELGRPEQAVAAGERGVGGGVPEPLSPQFELALVEALRRASRPRDALDVVARLKRGAHRSDQVAPLLELDYELYVQDGDLAAARQTAAKLADAYQTSDEAERVSLDLSDRVTYGDMGNSELLAHAGVMTVHGRYRDARSILKMLDRRKLSGRQREQRSIVKAQYYYETGDYQRAAALARPRFTDKANRRASVLILARSYRRAGDRKKAADVYRQFARLYPNQVKASEALYVAAGLYERAGDDAKAQEALYVLRKSYPSSYYGKMAAYRGARYFFEVRNYDRSVAILERAVKRSRYTDAAAMYYLADTYGKLGRNDDKVLLLKSLREFNPQSFYLSWRVPRTFRRPATSSTGSIVLDGDHGLVAFLAGVSLRKEIARRSIIAAVSRGDTPADFGPEAATCLNRGRWFLEVGFRDWGEAELAQASKRCFDSPAALLALGEVYDRFGLPWHSIRLYQRVKDSMQWQMRREYADQFAYLMYPIPYPVQVLENAAQYDLPPHLVYAMIREESRFDRKAVSRVGALGLMQLMPETGRYVARELEMPQLTEEGLLDPEVNLAFGIWYASSLLDRSGGNYLRMLSAYNAGPSNAKRWFARAGSEADPIEVVDRIDYKETRRYVQRIVESANVYHRLYFDAGAAPSGSSR
jgi:soluble lytic murein transglycosylase